MDRNEVIYFVNSQGKTAYLVSPNSNNYWEMKGRYGFKAPELKILTTNYASGKTRFDGKIIQPRNCGVKLICVGKNSAEKDKVFFDMLDVLLDADGTKEGKLYVRRSDGFLAYVNCVYSSGMNIVEEYQKFQRFTVEFYAADPWFYSTHETAITASNQIVNNPYKDVVYPEIYAENPCYTKSSPERRMILNRETSQTLEFYTVEETRNLFSKQFMDLHIFLSPTEKYVDAYVNRFIPGENPYFGMGHEAIVGDARNKTFSLLPGDNAIETNWAYYNQQLVFIFSKKYAGV